MRYMIPGHENMYCNTIVGIFYTVLLQAIVSTQYTKHVLQYIVNTIVNC
jgi:hypothetical protein